jgi:hypothetical protein
VGWARFASLATFGPLLVAVAAGAAPDGLHATPSLYWQGGRQRVDLGLALRSRVEWWDAYATEAHSIVGTRARLRLSYGWADTLFLTGEVQAQRLDSMEETGTGAIATHRAANGARYRAHDLDVRGLHLELRPAEGAWLRLGRQDVKLGSEVLYPEADWRYLKTARVGERLVGTVGWTHVERAYDGVAGGWDLGSHTLFCFLARPTTGVLTARDAYDVQHDLAVGGGAFTVERGAWLPSTELSAFAIDYDDDRSPSRGGLAQGVHVTSVGAHALGIHPVGPGRLDLLLWAAGQGGRYDGLDHEAWAALLEAGYQWPDRFAKPWLRAGLNLASGDGDPGDRDHATFFNLLPTNHIYYGFADQLAFQNLWNPFVQLRLAPHPKLAVNLFVHWFRLMQEEDSRYSGSGAATRDAFGFAAQPSGGERDVGTEYDLVLTLTPHAALTLETGLSWLDGGSVFRGRPDRDVAFGYASVELRY